MSIRSALFAFLLATGLAGSALADLAPGPRPRPGPPGRANQQNAGDAAALAGGMLCLIGVAAIVVIVVQIVIVLFIVSDARKRGMDPTLWVVLEIFVGLLGLIIYLCVRERLLTDRPRHNPDYTDDHDDDDPDRLRRSRRLQRERDEDRRRDDDY